MSDPSFEIDTGALATCVTKMEGSADRVQEAADYCSDNLTQIPGGEDGLILQPVYPVITLLGDIAQAAMQAQADTFALEASRLQQTLDAYESTEQGNAGDAATVDTSGAN